MEQVTIWKDELDCLHIFKGWNIDLIIIGSSTALHNGKESHLFMQYCGDVEVIEADLSAEDLDNLNNGYAINTSIDSLYFND